MSTLGHRPSQRWKLAAVLGGMGLVAACSAARKPDAPETAAETESQEDDVSARVIAVTTSGELCPPWQDKNHDGLSDNVTIGTQGDNVTVLAGPAASTPGSTPPPPSAEPSCSVTLEVEVPEGFQMGAPHTTWKGDAAGPAGPASATRTYAFESGESSSTAAANLDGPFMIVDREVPVFSPTCSGQRRVRVTATFLAPVDDVTADGPGDLSTGLAISEGAPEHEGSEPSAKTGEEESGETASIEHGEPPFFPIDDAPSATVQDGRHQ